jgi:hypothetical protein
MSAHYILLHGLRTIRPSGYGESASLNPLPGNRLFSICMFGIAHRSLRVCESICRFSCVPPQAYAKPGSAEIPDVVT